MDLTPQPAARLLAATVAAAFATALSLLLPWFELSGRRRSSIDLIGSAATLDVIEGTSKALVIGAWLAIPVTVAAVMLIAASGRSRLAARLLLPIGPLLAVCVVAIVAKARGAAAWGLWVSLVFAVVTSILAAFTLRRSASSLPRP